MYLFPERERLPDLDQLQYEILEWIPTKSDGMARLVKAQAPSGDAVAIKIARIDENPAITEKHNQAIVAEAACLQSLAPNAGIVSLQPAHTEDSNQPQFHGTLAEEGNPAYLVQPYLEGATLSRYVGTEPVDLKVALNITQALAQTLSVVHENQWVHRDLKPNNIMFRERPPMAERGVEQGATPGAHNRDEFEPESGTAPVLIDFGIATRAGQDVAAEGTVSWMAPEVREAFESSGTTEVTPSCDVYGLGLILCYMLSGQRPAASYASTQNKISVTEAAYAAINQSSYSTAHIKSELIQLIDSTLDEDQTKRPTADTISQRVAEINGRLRYPLSFVQRISMVNKRYSSPLWRITGSIVVALMAILLGRQLLNSPSEDDIASNSISLAETVIPTATVTILPSGGFPIAEGAATATLLPSASEANAYRADGNESARVAASGNVGQEAGEPQGVARAAGQPDSRIQKADGGSSGGVAELSNATPIANPTAQRSGFGWLPSFSFPSNLLGGFSWLATPVPATPTAAPTPSPTATHASGADLVQSTALTTTQFVFPEVAPLVQITGNVHPCLQDWKETDTWNKHASDSTITIQWKIIEDIPYNAEARFKVGIALDEAGLTPYRAHPISAIVKGNQIEVDPLTALWTINGLVGRDQVVNEPYVWAVFLVGASGGFVTRASPICYFQLDGRMESRLPNE